MNEKNMVPTLDIVIVNWNSGIQLSECLDSIIETQKNNFLLNRVIVVDNASSDNSFFYPESDKLPLEIIKNKMNIGFGRACNQGAASSSADYLLFLNPDTRLFKDSLQVPVDFLSKEKNENVGICGIKLVGDNATTNRHCSKFPTYKHFVWRSFGLEKLWSSYFNDFIMSDWDHESTREVDHVIGAFYLVRKTVFKSLQGFDERFFVYLEDLDFSLRAKRQGWKVIYLSDASAYHLGGGTSNNVKARRLFYSIRSKLLFSFKHYSKLSAFLVLLVTIFIEPITRVSYSISKASFEDVKNTILGFCFLILDIPTMFKINKKYEKP